MERSTIVIIFVLLSLLNSSTDAGFGIKPHARERRADNKDWSYSGDTGPDYWVEIGYEKCGGKRQSPIVLDESSAIAKVVEPNLECVGCDVVRSGMSLENDGKTVLLKLADNLPYLKDGGLDGKYMFLHIDFHFGKDKMSNAGHVIHYQGKEGLMNNLEVHVVFQNAEGKVAALAFLFREDETGETTENFKPILKYLDNIRYKGTQMQIKESFSLESILQNLDEIWKGKYFRYEGSRTEPPCTECVTWSVYNTIDVVSKELMAKLRSLLSTTEDSKEPQPLYGNVRPPQDRNGRDIFFISFNENT